jgi:hypothetical protein
MKASIRVCTTFSIEASRNSLVSKLKVYLTPLGKVLSADFRYVFIFLIISCALDPGVRLQEI